MVTLDTLGLGFIESHSLMETSLMTISIPTALNWLHFLALEDAA